MSPGRRTKRPGSRLLLALALAGGALAALYGGALLADLIADALRVASIPARLVLKVLLMAATLPAAFYLVERFFVERSRRGGTIPGRPDDPKA